MFVDFFSKNEKVIHFEKSFHYCRWTNPTKYSVEELRAVCRYGRQIIFIIAFLIKSCKDIMQNTSATAN